VSGSYTCALDKKDLPERHSSLASCDKFFRQGWMENGRTCEAACKYGLGVVKVICENDGGSATIIGNCQVDAPFLIVGVCSGTAFLALLVCIGCWSGEHASTCWTRIDHPHKQESDVESTGTSRRSSFASGVSTAASEVSIGESKVSESSHIP